MTDRSFLSGQIESRPSSTKLAKQLKRCTKCGKIKPLTDFHKNRASKDGRASQCAVCRRIYQKAYRKGHERRPGDFSIRVKQLPATFLIHITELYELSRKEFKNIDAAEAVQFFNAAVNFLDRLCTLSDAAEHFLAIHRRKT